MYTLIIVFFYFRTLPFKQFVKRASEDVHEEYFICPVSSSALHSLRVLSQKVIKLICSCKDKFYVRLKDVS